MEKKTNNDSDIKLVRTLSLDINTTTTKGLQIPLSNGVDTEINNRPILRIEVYDENFYTGNGTDTLPPMLQVDLKKIFISLRYNGQVSAIDFLPLNRFNQNILGNTFNPIKLRINFGIDTQNSQLFFRDNISVSSNLKIFFFLGGTINEDVSDSVIIQNRRNKIVDSVNRYNNM